MYFQALNLFLFSLIETLFLLHTNITVFYVQSLCLSLYNYITQLEMTGYNHPVAFQVNKKNHAETCQVIRIIIIIIITDLVFGLTAMYILLPLSSSPIMTSPNKSHLLSFKLEHQTCVHLSMKYKNDINFSTLFFHLIHLSIICITSFVGYIYLDI